jgi:RNA polymerase sigma factor (sigma-70 family)
MVMSMNGSNPSGLGALAAALKARFGNRPTEPDTVWHAVAGHPATLARMQTLARRKAREYNWASPDVAGELVQDGLLRLRSRLKAVDFNRSPGEIARFLDQQFAWCCADAARKFSGQLGGVPVEDLEWVEALPPEENIEAQHLDVLEALLYLPAPLRLAVNLRLAGQTLEQISSTAGVSISTVHRQLNQACRMLRSAMER